MIHKLYHAAPQHFLRFIFRYIRPASVAGCALLMSCTANNSNSFCDESVLSDTLASVEKSEQATLRYLEEARTERKRVEEIYNANRLLVEKYVAEQKKTQQACKKGTGNLSPNRLNRITPVPSLTEQKILELNKANAASPTIEVSSGKPTNSIDPPYSPSDAPGK